ncbi:MAG: zinc finger protein [Candidatus Eremiobacteraeota bacterium]|nr:zinc finger protein [Candidatus Eremiobacteraeota bacterium]
MAVHEGAWDCPNCEYKGNKGPDKHCTGCGAPRGDDVKFYLPDSAREVTSEAELTKAQAGPDWKCPFCGGDNKAGAPACTGCGAAKDGAATREVKDIRFDRREQPPSRTPPPGASGSLKRSLSYGCGCFVLFVVFFLALIAFGSRDTTLKVSGFQWTRTVEVEKLGTFRETAWEGEVPAGARIRERTRAVHHYDQVQTGTVTRTRLETDKVQSGTEKVKVGVKDKGNGYFEDIYEERPLYREVERTVTYQDPVYKQVPSYRTKLAYDIDRWNAARTEKAEGKTQEARWPDLRTAESPAKEREGKKTEKYLVLFADAKGNSYPYEARSEAEWLTFKEGQHYKARLDLFKKITRLEGPK